jgi:hypothetical protein
MTNRTPWTPAENAALVRLYFAMLSAQRNQDQHGMTYNKAGMIRHFRGEALGAWLDGDDHGALANRTRGSIEAKLMNASACHRDLMPSSETMDDHGYRALSNYQAALKEAMAHALAYRGHRSQELTAYYVAKRSAEGAA